MWGALQGNSLIRTFHVGIRCSSLKMRKKSTSRAMLCRWCHLLLFIESSCNIQSLTMTRKDHRCLKPVGTIKDSTKGRKISYVPALVCDSSREWKRKCHLKSWKPCTVQAIPLIIGAVWHYRVSFNTMLPLQPSQNSSPLRHTFCIFVTVW